MCRVDPVLVRRPRPLPVLRWSRRCRLRYRPVRRSRRQEDRRLRFRSQHRVGPSPVRGRQPRFRRLRDRVVRRVDPVLVRRPRPAAVPRSVGWRVLRYRPVRRSRRREERRIPFRLQRRVGPSPVRERQPRFRRLCWQVVRRVDPLPVRNPRPPAVPRWPGKCRFHVRLLCRDDPAPGWCRLSGICWLRFLGEPRFRLLAPRRFLTLPVLPRPWSRPVSFPVYGGSPVCRWRTR